MRTQSYRLQQGNTVKNRSALAKFLIIVLPMWISAKFYNGPYFEFINTYFAALIVIILLGILTQLVFTRAKEKSILVTIFILLSLLQIVALLFPSLYSEISFSIANTTLFGGEYTINMIPYYGVGGFIGFFVLRSCKARRS